MAHLPANTCSPRKGSCCDPQQGRSFQPQLHLCDSHLAWDKADTTEQAQHPGEDANREIHVTRTRRPPGFLEGVLKTPYRHQDRLEEGSDPGAACQPMSLGAWLSRAWGSVLEAAQRLPEGSPSAVTGLRAHSLAAPSQSLLLATCKPPHGKEDVICKTEVTSSLPSLRTR